MFEKIIPVIIALIALQFLVKFMNKRKKNNQAAPRDFEYKQRINEFMKLSNFNEGGGGDQPLRDEILSKLGNPELLMEIPDSMRDVRRGLNLIIDGVTHAVRGKTGSGQIDEIKYTDPGKMFDELVEVINRHRM